LCCALLEGKDYEELSAFPDLAGHVNAAVMFFGDPARQRESQACSVSLGRVEGSEDVVQKSGRDTTARVDNGNRGDVLQKRNLNPYLARTVNRLNRVQQQIQEELVDLIDIVFDVGQVRVFVEVDLDWFGEHLQAGQRYGMFNRCIQVSRHNEGNNEIYHPHRLFSEWRPCRPDPC